MSSANQTLPSLPVPSLYVTASALLKSLRSLLPDEEYLRAKAKVDEFVSPGGVGHTLQTRLLDHAKASRNWHTDLFIDKQYWENRLPVAPFTSYFGWHEHHSKEASESAALICTALLQFQQHMEEVGLQSDMIRNSVADMSQYGNLFHSCRLPLKSKDTIVRFDPALHRHFIVARKGHFFKLHYIDEIEGRRLNKVQLKTAIKSILALDLGPAVEIGALTTADRDTWADERSRLMNSSPTVKRMIEDIESSCFLICLDETKPKTREDLASQIFYGGGGINRWYDKPVQFVVMGDGSTGMVGEHSASDGTPVLRLNGYVLTVINEAAMRPAETDAADLGGLPNSIIPLRFPVTSCDYSLLARSREGFEEIVSNEKVVVLRINHIGGAKLAAVMKPNTCVQLMLNLAAYRMYGELKPNYEPVSLSSFVEGRWTCCSMVTEEVLNFCRVANDPKTTQGSRLEALHIAAKAHRRNISKVVRGIENTEAHLWALQQMLHTDEETPELFIDSGYNQSQDFFLSATFLPSDLSFYYGFWPIVPDGVAIGNMIRGDRLEILMLSGNGRLEELSNHIKKAIDDVAEILGINELRSNL